MYFVSICPINVLDILNIVGSNIGNSNLVLIGDMCCSRGGGGDCCFLGTFISSNLIKTKAGKWFIKIWQKNQVESWGGGGIYLHHLSSTSHQLRRRGNLSSSPVFNLLPAEEEGNLSSFPVFNLLPAEEEGKFIFIPCIQSLTSWWGWQKVIFIPCV